MSGAAGILRVLSACLAIVAAAFAAFDHEVLRAVLWFGIALFAAVAGRTVLGPFYLLIALALGLAVLRVAAFDLQVWLATGLVWLLGWIGVALLAEARPQSRLLARGLALAIPLIFGTTVLWLWEMLRKD